MKNWKDIALTLAAVCNILIAAVWSMTRAEIADLKAGQAALVDRLAERPDRAEVRAIIADRLSAAHVISEREALTIIADPIATPHP